MEKIRRQLTLFISEANANVEKIRAEFNPEQYKLIAAHVTLCREDEIDPIEKTIARIESIVLEKPIRIKFGKALRFSDGKGVYLSSFGDNKEFRELRKLVLGQDELKKEQIPHITLMHPRNSTCTDEKFERIENYDLPTELKLCKISLIEQKNGGRWEVLREFDIVKSDFAEQGK